MSILRTYHRLFWYGLGVLLASWGSLALAAQDPILKNEVSAAVAEFQRSDPTLEAFFANSAGYVVFPSIAKAGFIIGGARGRGEVFRQGNYIGNATLTQATIGLQVGGQTYHEIIFFKDPWRLDQFMTGNFAFSASVSAVAVTAGAGRSANYHQGVAVFTLAKGGLMLEASVGGQKFGFRADAEAAQPVEPVAEQPEPEISADDEHPSEPTPAEPMEQAVLITEPLLETPVLMEIEPAS